MSFFRKQLTAAVSAAAPHAESQSENRLLGWFNLLLHSHAAGDNIPPVPTAGSLNPPTPGTAAVPKIVTTIPAPKPKPIEPPAEPTISLLENGAIRSSLIVERNAKYTGPGRVVNDIVFLGDTDKLFTLNKEQQDNLDYNRAEFGSVLGGMALHDGITGMLQAYSAVLIEANGEVPAHFDKTTVKAIDCTLASPDSTTDIPALIEAWDKAGYWPVQVEQIGSGTPGQAGAPTA